MYGKDDPENEIDAGLADSELGLRLRYEFRRELAPYLGVVWTRNYHERNDRDDVRLVAGLRVWI